MCSFTDAFRLSLSNCCISIGDCFLWGRCSFLLVCVVVVVSWLSYNRPAHSSAVYQLMLTIGWATIRVPASRYDQSYLQDIVSWFCLKNTISLEHCCCAIDVCYRKKIKKKRCYTRGLKYEQSAPPSMP